MQATINMILDDKDIIDITFSVNKIRCRSGKTDLLPTAELIIANTAKYYGLSYDDLVSRNREYNIINAQQVTMYIIRKLTNYSLGNIGKLFHCDYSKVLASLRHIEEKIHKNPNFASEVKSIIKEISNEESEDVHHE